MAIYYGYRMYAITPWYDELYTYYCFISKGPVYAAIHWPLPNNHVGYSVLSGCLDFLGNSYIGLRGISYLCALLNLILIKKIAEKFLEDPIPLIVTGLYGSFYLVNQQAVQGRGYTLGITCFLAALWCLSKIVECEEIKKRYYFGFAGVLILALYTLTSDVYFVIPLCFAGGAFLLFHKEIRKLIKLMIWSLAAAVGTLFLYAIIWLAIGSNLLVKDTTGIYYGMSHAEMILKSPFAAMGRGMEYMLATPYIQSEERAGFFGRLLSFFASLCDFMVQKPRYLALLIVCIGIVGMLFVIIKKWKQHQNTELFWEFVLLFQLLFVPICLMIQCKRPYYRVFTYLGAVLALTIGFLLQILLKKVKSVKTGIVMTVLTMCYLLYCLFFTDYNAPYGERENLIADAWKNSPVSAQDSICVTDCNQEYLLYFLYGIRCENHDVQNADIVMLDKRIAEPEFDEMVWEWYVYHEDIPWDYLEKEMIPVYENDGYMVYIKRKGEKS